MILLDRCHQVLQTAELARQSARLVELKRQQKALIEARYADAIPLDLLKSEQERISRELVSRDRAGVSGQSTVSPGQDRGSGLLGITEPG